jgi:hypothetical protein
LTEKQVKQVTPLVVDLSRKLGIDLDQAAKVVGKTIATGTAGPLKKLGINLDESKLKGDAFGATIEGLSKTVGGFARQEGATFAGQLAILKNNLGDIGENVGKGAASVFSDIAGGLAKLAGASSQAGPAIGETLGRIAAYGSIGVGGLSGLAAIGGQVIKLRDAFTTLGDNGERSLSRLGKAAAAFGAVIGTIALADVLGNLGNDLGGYAEKADRALQKLGKTLNDTNATTQVTVENFGAAAKAQQDQWTGLGDAIASIGREVHVNGSSIGIDIEHIDETFKNLLASSGPQAGQALVDALVRQAAALDPTSQKYRDYYDIIQRLVPLLGSAQSATGEVTTATGQLQVATDNAASSYKVMLDTISGIVDPVMSAADAERKLAEAQQKTADAQARVNQLTIDGKTNSPEYAQALKDLAAANLAQEQAAISQDKALGALGTTLANQPGLVQNYKAEIDQLLASGKITQAQYDDLNATLNRQVGNIAALDAVLTKINGKTATVNVVANVPDNIFGIPIPAAPTPKTLPKPKKKPGNVNNGFFSNIPGFASGGDIGAGTLATVNERGPEMFMPRTDGFIMNASDSKRLVSGVEQLLSGGGGQTFNITTTDPVLTAAEVVRRQRDAQFLLGR